MTGNSLEDQLAAAAAAVREHELATARQAELRRTVDKLNVLIEQLWSSAATEARDVARLEGISLTRVVLALRGRHADALAREQAELDAARLRALAAEDRLAAVRQELEAVTNRLWRRQHARRDLDRLLAEKEKLVGATLPGLAEVAVQRGAAEAELGEVAEAQAAAERADQALERLAGTLSDAGAWSTYDTYFGGRMLASMNKLDLLDRAAEEAAAADRCLGVLRTELADVPGLLATIPDVGGTEFTQFVDVWFDNFFTDVRTHERIREAEARVAGCRRRVETVANGLWRREAAVRGRLAELMAERQALLLS